jgi:hypothetical protein
MRRRVPRSIAHVDLGACPKVRMVEAKQAMTASLVAAMPPSVSRQGVPLSNSNLTTPTCPAAAAMWRAVFRPAAAVTASMSPP